MEEDRCISFCGREKKTGNCEIVTVSRIIRKTAQPDG